MGDEAVDGSKMGTKLIFFVAILAIALAAFIVGKNLVNTGVSGLEQSAQNIDDSRYSDYNGKVVRGRTIKSALDTFANEEVAIVIATLSCADNEGEVLTGTNMPNYDEQAVTPQLSGVSMTKSDGTVTTATNALYAINYNAQLADGAVISYENGVALYEGDFSHDTTGQVKYYLNTKNINIKGSGEYIADNSSFNATLIKNSAGEICGILFAQKKLA